MKHLVISNIVKFNIVLPKYLKTLGYSHNTMFCPIVEYPLKYIFLEETNHHFLDNIPNGIPKIDMWNKLYDATKNNNLPSNGNHTI